MFNFFKKKKPAEAESVLTPRPLTKKEEKQLSYSWSSSDIAVMYNRTTGGFIEHELVSKEDLTNKNQIKRLKAKEFYGFTDDDRKDSFSLIRLAACNRFGFGEEDLSDSNPAIRSSAMVALKCPDLFDKDPCEDVRLLAIKAKAILVGPSAIADDTPAEDRVLYYFLKGFNSEALEDKNQTVRLAAYRSLGFTAKALEDPSALIRLGAYEHFGFNEDALNDPSTIVRGDALLKLYIIRKAEEVEAAAAKKAERDARIALRKTNKGKKADKKSA